MFDPGAVDKLSNILRQLDTKCGELAEVKKAELTARKSNFHGNTVTEARENAANAAMEFTLEAIDLQADIDSLERWRDYYRLIIEHS